MKNFLYNQWVRLQLNKDIIDYQKLQTRVSIDDLMGIYLFLMCNHQEIATQLIKEKAIRFDKNRELYSTIHIIENDCLEKPPFIIFDPNSKLARPRFKHSTRKDATPKRDQNPKKLIGKGGIKRVREGWLLNPENGRIEDLAILVWSDDKVKAWSLNQKVFQTLRDEKISNPFILPMMFGAKYLKRTAHGFIYLKTIAFAPRAEGDLSELKGKSPDIGDLLWIFYASISGLSALHKAGIAHRDIKPGNILFFHTPHGISIWISDFDFSKIMARSSEKDLKSYGNGTAGFFAFDSYFFRDLISIHNSLVKDEKQDRPSNTQFQMELKVKQNVSLRSRKKNNDMAFHILSRQSHVEINESDDKANDIWALMRVWRIILYTFLKTDSLKLEFKTCPEILNKVLDITINNLFSPYKKRQGAETILSQVNNLLTNFCAPTLPALGLTSEQHETARKKILAQFKYFGLNPPNDITTSVEALTTVGSSSLFSLETYLIEKTDSTSSFQNSK